MKVVALVSGGKDSCFAMMECVRYGHEIACLAHLRPPAELAPEAAEIDSFMYQSVGHNVVSLIAESMELPLVTGIITGTAVTTEIDYPETKDGDEVEDLFRLLQDVRARHPDIQGVCTGAIFSSYQRNRVESVCARLGLTSLGYLWRRDQEELLEEMIDSGIEAIIVKVASIGLQPRKHLGRTITDLQMEFLQLQEKYQLNVCGEGGEYETLTLDCPLFKKRIVVDQSRTVLHSDDYFAPVAFLVIEQCHLEEKEPSSPSKLATKLPPPEMLPTPLNLSSSPVQQRTPTAVTLASVGESERRAIVPDYSKFRDQLHLSGVTSTTNGLTLAEEMADIFRQAQEVLDREGMTLDDVCFVHLYVYDMSAFGAINAEYCRYFGQYMPPSRSCVEVASIAPTRVLMDCFALRGSGTSKRRPQRLVRDVLHVKSISCWAPHCIGPYSQANILHCSLILLAGQIALLPQTMGLVGPDHQSQGKQSFVNAGHALEALDSNLRHVCSAVIYATRDAAGDADLQRIRASSRDQLRQNAGLYDVFEHAEDSDESDDEVDKGELLVALVKDAPLLVVQVSHLPRSALVEVELQALTHKVVKHLSPRSEVFAGKLVDGQVEFQSECSMVDRALCLSVTTAKWTGSGINSGDAAASVLSPSQIQRLCDALWSATTSGLVNALVPWDRVFHTRVFYVATAFTCELELAAAVKKSLPSSVSTSTSVEMPALTFVPVEHIQHGAQIAVQVLAQDLDKLETELWLRKQV